VVNSTPEEYSSFGVYLGNFDTPLLRDQADLISRWDVVVLNPCASGIGSALSSCAQTPRQILARLDVRSLTDQEAASNDEDIIHAIRLLERAVKAHFASSNGIKTPFTAILLANFNHHFSPPVLNELVTYSKSLGIPIWLEVSHPNYLSDADCRQIRMNHIAGIVYRNGTIRTGGEQQNFHQMSPMRTMQRAIAAQRCAHGPPMMLWETIDDEVEHQYAVTQRCFNWCRFNSALPWIGSHSALADTEAACKYTVNDKPLGALMWMKDDANMRAHNIWRTNDRVGCFDVFFSVFQADQLYRSLRRTQAIVSCMTLSTLSFQTLLPNWRLSRQAFGSKSFLKGTQPQLRSVIRKL
jgi:hypothetical protein